MDLVFYNAAVEGKIEPFKETEKPLHDLLTPNRNTVLHIHLTSLTREPGLSTANFVEEILYICPSLLLQVNAKNESPLHIAARYGHATIVEVLIEQAQAHHQDLESGLKAAREILKMTNIEKNTAFHDAIRYNHLEVVKLLIKVDPDFSYLPNDVGETPLYMAVERKFQDLVYEILSTCSSPAFDGPLGRTALHAAVILKDEGMTERILERIKTLGAVADQQGSTPLHLAAYFNSISTTKLLLKVDKDLAYKKDALGRTPLHIAAHRANYNLMEEILLSCPDCCELVDKRGWNALHFAVNSSFPWSYMAVNVILKNQSLSDLVNEKDCDGNTPLHHHSNSSTCAWDLLISHKRVDKLAFNNKNLDAYDIALTSLKLPEDKFTHINSIFRRLPIFSFRQFRRVSKDDFLEATEYDTIKHRLSLEQNYSEYTSGLEKANESNLIVCALIATVTFAAGITMPGGFKNDGSPNLLRGFKGDDFATLIGNLCFKIFVIVNAIAMILSTSAAWIHIVLKIIFFRKRYSIYRNYLMVLAYILTLFALIAMLLAFVTGTYAVLMHSMGIAIVTCIMGLSPLVGYIIIDRSIQKKLSSILPIEIEQFLVAHQVNKMFFTDDTWRG